MEDNNTAEVPPRDAPMPEERQEEAGEAHADFEGIVPDAASNVTNLPVGEGRESDEKLVDSSVLPHNTQAEQGLLGALLYSPKAYEPVGEIIQPENFFNPVHGRIYKAIRKLVERGQIANAVTLKTYFQQDGDLEHVGGAAYLAELQGNVVSASNARHYAELVHDLFMRREIIELGTEMAENANVHDLDLSAQNHIESAETKLYKLAETGDVSGGFVSLGESVTAAVASAEIAYKSDSGVSGVTSGFKGMDNQLGGLHPSDLIIVAGRPSMGKTALATNICYRCAEAALATNGKEGGVVAFFSLEMSAEQLAGRILADVAEIPSNNIRKGDIKDADFQNLVEASAKLAKVPLHIDDTPAITVSAMRSRCRRLKRTSGLGLVVVDYLQLMTASESRGQGRVQEISEITRGLKGLAKEFEVPVIALSQLSRNVESREDKRPQLSDLRESGSIEQDADVVMFVYRAEYYLERAEPTQRPEEDTTRFNERYENWRESFESAHNIAEAIIAKQRHGPIGILKMHFEGQFTRFTDLDDHHNEGY